MSRAVVVTGRVLLSAALLSLCANALGADETETARSTEHEVVPVGFDCKSNVCSSAARGCASCVRLTVTLPEDVWVFKTHCWSTAKHPSDYSRHELHEVPCGVDVAWSQFDTPTVSIKRNRLMIETTYHNRSSDRTRDVRVDVDWRPGEESATASVAPVTEDAISQSLAAPVPRELVNGILWSIEARGCDVFVGSERRRVSDLRACYTDSQRTPGAAAIIRGASLEQLSTATARAVARSWGEYEIRKNVEWVMVHEHQAARFRELAEKGQVTEIRRAYKLFQSPDTTPYNALSALSDSQIGDLVYGRPIDGESGEPPAELTQYIVFSILRGCSAFHGDGLRDPEALRRCYQGIHRQNRNAQALEMLSSATRDTVTWATERALLAIREQYSVGQTIIQQLTVNGGIQSIRSNVAKRAFAAAREEYNEVFFPDEPRLLNALADSELLAIMNQYRAAVIVRPESSGTSLLSLGELLEPATVGLTGDTTEAALIRVVCDGVLPVSPPERYLEHVTACNTLVRRAILEQGLTITSAGIVRGDRAVNLPTLPRLGVPTLVAFRTGVTEATAKSRLAASSAPSTAAQVARLVPRERVRSLSASTSAQDSRSEYRWYAGGIAADRIRETDVELHGPVRVGIIDAGVDTEHEVLKPFFWKIPVTPQNVPWERGSIGYDYVRNVSNPEEDKTPQVDGSLESHGTHIAGLVAARGLALWLPVIGSLKLEDHVKIYSLKVADGPQGVIPDFSLALQALADTLPNQIHLLNMSLEGPRVPFLREEIRKHRDDTLIVLAAGNDGKNLNEGANHFLNGTFRYDDGRPLENVIIVAALMNDGGLTPDSNRGDIAVQIAAPGDNIYSTVQGGGFDAITGTSQAAPLVTATVALLLAEQNGAFPSALKGRLLATCDWDEALKKDHLVAEGCRLNMAKAITATTDIVELVATDAQGRAKWLRGKVERDQFELRGDDGGMIERADIQRIRMLGVNGRVMVAVVEGGRKNATLLPKRVRITLDPGEQCPDATDPCEVACDKVRDIVFRWDGQH